MRLAACLLLGVGVVFVCGCGAHGPGLPDEAETAGGNYCLQFDGAGDVVSIPYSSALDFGPHESFTLECWFKTSATATGPASSHILIGTWNDGTSAGPFPYELRLWLGDTWADGNLEFIVYDGVAFDTLYVPGHWNDGRWHHVAAVRKGIQSMKVFMDRNPPVGIVPAANRQNTHNGQPVSIGAHVTGFEAYSGRIDDVRIWNRARTQAQIRANMNLQLPGSTPNLVGYWKLNDGSGLRARDASPNHNHGTLLNGPIWRATPWPLS